MGCGSSVAAAAKGDVSGRLLRLGAGGDDDASEDDDFSGRDSDDDELPDYLGLDSQFRLGAVAQVVAEPPLLEDDDG